MKLGDMVEHVTHLAQPEPVKLDHARLGALYSELGPEQADDLVCRALEELALRLAQLGHAYREGRNKDLHKGARLLAAIADQLGMSTTAQVARDVTRCLDMADPVALAAVVARLLRSGERSLLAVWDVDVTSP